MHALAAAEQVTGGKVQRQVRKFCLVQLHVALAAGKRPHPRQQFFRRKGLGHIVVRTAVQPRNLAAQLIARGQHQHRGAHVLPPQLVRHFKTVHLRQHDVQHDHIVLSAGRVIQSVLPVEHHIGAVFLFFHNRAQRFSQAAFVLYNQDPHEKAPPFSALCFHYRSGNDLCHHFTR